MNKSVCVLLFALFVNDIPSILFGQNLQWVSSNPFKGGSIRVFAERENGDIYGMNDGAIFLSTDEGMNWSLIKQFSLGSEEHLNSLTVSGSGIICVAKNSYSAGSILISRDAGASWELLILPKQLNGYSCFFTTGDTLIVSSFNFYRTGDLGKSWDTLGYSGYGAGQYSGFTKARTGRLFYFGDYGRVGYSDDNGGHWKSAVNLTVGNLIHAACSNSLNEIFVSHSDGISASSDTGNTWFLKNTGLFDYFTNGLVIDSNNTLFAGTTYTGVYASTNSGVSWQQVNNGLYDTHIFSVFLTRKNILLAASSDRVFRTVTTLSAPSNAKNSRASQLYPNPTHGICQLTYNNSDRKSVGLSIFDILGNEVLKIKDRNEGAGVTTEEIDARGLLSGSYFCRLQIGDQVEIKPFQVIR